MSLAQSINSLHVNAFVSIDLLEPHGTQYYTVKQVTADSIVFSGQGDIAVPLTTVQAFVQARRVHVYRSIDELPQHFRDRVESLKFNESVNDIYRSLLKDIPRNLA